MKSVERDGVLRNVLLTVIQTKEYVIKLLLAVR